MVKKFSAILTLFILFASCAYAGTTVTLLMTYEGVLDSGEDFSIRISKKEPTKEPASGYMSTNPSFVVNSIAIRIGDIKISFPENALHDLTEPRMHYAKIYSSYDGEYIFKLHGADGGGAWHAKFTFTKAKLPETISGVSDCSIFGTV